MTTSESSASVATEDRTRGLPGSTRRRNVAAVVLAYNSLDSLQEVLRSISAQMLPVYRTLVVDNGSTDGTPTYLQGLGGHVDSILLDHNRGVGAGHNRGWDEALRDPDVDFIWALEHDTLPPPSCLSQLLATFLAAEGRGSQIGAVLPVQVLTEQAAAMASEQGIGEARSTSRPPIPLRKLTFNACLFSREAVQAVGWLREDFFVGQEDREYALRLSKAGFTILRDPLALVVHRNKGVRRRGPLSVMRTYYARRNETYLSVHVRKEPLGSIRATARTLGAVARTILSEDRKLDRVQARVRATFDGITGRLGHQRYSFLHEP